MADQNKRNAAPGTDNRRAYLSDNKSVDYKTPHTAKVAAAAEMKQDMAGGIEDGPTPTPEATVKTELAQAVRETEGDSTSVARSLAGAVAGMRRDDRREIRTKVRAATVNLPTKSTVGENSGSLLRARTYWECKTPFVFTVLRPQRSIVSIHGEEGADASREKEPSGTGNVIFVNCKLLPCKQWLSCRLLPGSYLLMNSLCAYM